MDDFLREIQTSVFREWINNQKRDYYHLHQSETDPDAIIIENEYCYSYVTFNPQCIIELCEMKWLFISIFNSRHLNMPFLYLKKWINVLKRWLINRCVVFYYVVVGE